MLLVFAGNAIQLVPDGTLVFHLIVIILMVTLLNATLLKPINRILEERERRTKGRLSEAEATMLKVEQKLREYERQLREARAEGYSLMEKERLVVSGERDQKVAEVKSEIAQELSREKRIKKRDGARKDTLKKSRRTSGGSAVNSSLTRTGSRPHHKACRVQSLSCFFVIHTSIAISSLSST